LDEALVRVFPRPAGCSLKGETKGESKGDHGGKSVVRSKKGCGCEMRIFDRDFSSPMPIIEKPLIEENPFRDDTLQPPPLPEEPAREARLLLPGITNRTAAVQEPSAPVRAASYYFGPVRASE